MTTFTATYSAIALATYIYIAYIDSTFAQVESTKEGDKSVTAFILAVLFPLYFGIKVYSYFVPGE